MTLLSNICTLFMILALASWLHHRVKKPRPSYITRVRKEYDLVSEMISMCISTEDTRWLVLRVEQYSMYAENILSAEEHIRTVESLERKLKLKEIDLIAVEFEISMMKLQYSIS